MADCAQIQSLNGHPSKTFPKVEAELHEARERMESGQWFDAGSVALSTVRERTRTQLMTFNADASLSPQQRRTVLCNLLGSLGEHSDIMTGLQMDYGFNVYIGKRCFFNFNTVLLDGASITFGDDVWVGPNCTFATPRHPLVASERAMHIKPDGSAQCFEQNKAITVGSNVWIASNVTVSAGVQIGDGAVIGAGSVVTRDIPAGTLAVGVPCKPVRPISLEDSLADVLAQL